MEEKIIETGKGTVEKFLSGIEKIDALVGGTLGPFGRNRIIARKYRSPLVTNDGVTAARHAYLKDEIEDLAAQVLVEVAMKTNETAGDGTTSSVVIAAALAKAYFEKEKQRAKEDPYSKPGNPMQFAREVQKELKCALEILESQKKDLTQEDLAKVISTSLENLEFGETLGNLLAQVGKDGYVSTEDNWATKYGIETELTQGMRFLGTYASPYLANDERNEKDAVWEDTYVLVTNERLEMPTILTKVVGQMQEKNKNRLVIIGGHSENTNPFSKEFIAGLATVMRAAAKGNTRMIQMLAVKAPTLTSQELEDVAVFCNAKFFDKNLNMSVKDAEFAHLGFAKKIVVNEDDVNILEGAGNPTNRIDVLKEQMKREKDTMFKEKIKRRIASLSSAVGIIRVGASTEQERTYLKYKIEDAVAAAKAAWEEGIVPGGGLALKAIADKFGPDNVLYPALMGPYTRIRENAGGDIEVGPDIVDPHKVVRLALTNGCSAASMLVTCDGAIADRRMTLTDSLEKMVGKALRNSTDDFRDNENQDRGNGRHVD